jgi:aryl-alcohol dehydrogenase-like predicted oxidoreductase
VIDRLLALADHRDVSPAQIALAWLLGRPGVSAPIIGATKESHIDDAIAATSLSLSDDDVHSLEELYLPHASKV